jgi:GNAT superfamily N-acetyltransferase
VSSAGVRIETADPRSDEAQDLVTTYLAEIHDGFGHVPDDRDPLDQDGFSPPSGSFLVVRDETGVAVGCCAVRLLDPDTAEIKRMWLHPSMRGRGVGRLLLEAVERAALDLGATRGVLDTHASLTSALALYRSAGWVDAPMYNANAQATNWFSKDLRSADARNG